MGTISTDMTPDSIKTPEGAARVQKAQQEWERLQADMANGSERFFKVYGHLLEGDAKAKADMAELQETGREMLEAQDKFLRALAGRE